MGQLPTGEILLLMGQLPTGMVTFLFTDIEGSTRLLRELGERYVRELAEHRRFLREAFSAQGGVEVDTQGDAFFYAFVDASKALQAAQDAQQALAGGSILVRMGLHTGEPRLTAEGYVGLDVHLGARIAASAHGGQVVLSRATQTQLRDAFPLLDLGEHRVKDFAEPIWIYQLGSEHFPPLRTISNTNLPRAASSFVGRAQELDEVISLVRDGARLVTLSGPGGSGKTRLAIEAASELVPEFKAGVFWIGLVAVREPALVTETIAQTLGAREELSAYIGERQLLLLLDNLEQVIEAAPALSDLLARCANLQLIVTSRELLRVQGEIEYAVPPLAQTEAIELFCARASVEPDGEIAELCRRLDQLPLALELAAARTSALSPTQILERLSQRLDLLKGGRDVDARQQTLRAAIEWSYELLGGEEQRLLARLGVFPGGCNLKTAEEVVEADLDILQSLVEKSLLRHSGERFWMLETIRQYALERLEESGEAERVRARRDDHFLAFADGAGRELPTALQSRWLPQLDAEEANLRAVAASALERGRPDIVCRLAISLWRYWEARDRIADARRLIEPALEPEAEVSRAARAGALFAAGRMALRQGDYDAAGPWFAEGEALSAEEGNGGGRAQCLAGLGWIAIQQGHDEDAESICRESLALARASGDALLVSDSLNNLGCAVWLRDPDAARTAWEESLGLRRQIGHLEGVTASLGNLAQLAFKEGDLEQAAALAHECQRLAEDRGDLWTIAIGSLVLATVSIVSGRVSDSWPEVRRALELSETAGYHSLAADALQLAASCLALEGRDRDAATLDGVASSLGNVAWEAPFQFIGASLSLARERLGDRDWTDAREAGKRIEVHDAIELFSRATPTGRAH